MAFSDVASKLKKKGKGDPDVSVEDAMGKFKDENPMPKGKSKGKKGGFASAVKNAKKKTKKGC